MTNLMQIETVIELIKRGSILSLAGDEAILSKLPKGNWIGGTIPYFMGDDGGIKSNELIFVNDYSDFAIDLSIKTYTDLNLPSISYDEFEHGFSVIIVPAFSVLHKKFAENAPQYKDIFNNPLLGWVSGIDLDNIGKSTPMVFNGATGEFSNANAVVLHIKIESVKSARIEILNLFTKGKGDKIFFPETGFKVKDALINGETKNFADYLIENKIDIKLPLVADYYGAMINTSFWEINSENKEVSFYAPVFPNIEYAVASPIGNYIQEFESKLLGKNINPVFSCNCILNYLYSELEGKKTGVFKGPITFGEIAYQLLNQTLVYLTIE